MLAYLESTLEIKKIVNFLNLQQENNLKYPTAQISEYKNLNQIDLELTKQLSSYDKELIIQVRKVIEKLANFQKKSLVYLDTKLSESIVGRLITVATNSNSFNYSSLFIDKLGLDNFSVDDIQPNKVNLDTKKVFYGPNN